jgi:hypothetical protein
VINAPFGEAEGLQWASNLISVHEELASNCDPDVCAFCDSSEPSSPSNEDRNSEDIVSNTSGGVLDNDGAEMMEDISNMSVIGTEGDVSHSKSREDSISHSERSSRGSSSSSVSSSSSSSDVIRSSHSQNGGKRPQLTSSLFSSCKSLGKKIGTYHGLSIKRGLIHHIRCRCVPDNIRIKAAFLLVQTFKSVVIDRENARCEYCYQGCPYLPDDLAFLTENFAAPTAGAEVYCIFDEVGDVLLTFYTPLALAFLGDCGLLHHQCVTNEFLRADSTSVEPVFKKACVAAEDAFNF